MFLFFFFFFFNDTATTEIYTLSLHDALPIFTSLVAFELASLLHAAGVPKDVFQVIPGDGATGDRKSTRLNSSHGYISYAVFCLKKKKTNKLHAVSNTNQPLPLRVTNTHLERD